MTAPLTVMQLLPRLDGGGVERGTLEIAQALVKAGHRSVVVSGGGRLGEPLAQTGSEHITLPVGRKSLLTLRFVPTLRRLWQSLGVDVVHARSRWPAWLAYLAWRRMNPATRPHFVTTVHGAYSVNFYSAVMLKGERVIAVSDTIADYVLRNYPPFDRSRLEVIHRGVDTVDFPFDFAPDPAWRQQWDAEFPQLKGKQVLTLVGRLTRLKGHADFFDLIAALNQGGYPVYGLVVGGAEAGRRARYQHELQEAVRTRRLPVSFTGHRSDIREIYAISDLVLSLSSQPESFGRSVLEALSLGRPVVGYDHGGVGEILQATYPGGAVPLGDFDALLTAVKQHLDKRRIVRIPPVFPLDKMLTKTLALYESLTQGSGTRGAPRN